MKLIDILNSFEAFAPFSLQENYDNSGIQLGSPLREVNKGLICTDVTESIVDEAARNGCDVIISHHPLIFSGLKSITGSNYVERTLLSAIKNDIAIISVHTNLDAAWQGVNFKLASKLGLENTNVLDPRGGLLKKLVTFCPESHAEKVREAIFRAGAGKIGEYDSCSFNADGYGSFRAGSKANPFVGKIGEVHLEKEIRIETVFPIWIQNQVVAAMKSAHPYEEVAYDIYSIENKFDKVGMGVVGYLNDPVSEIDFLRLVKNKTGIGFLKHSEFTGKMVKKVAICGGSGSFLRNKAVGAGADAFITADTKYHDFFDVQQKLLMVDAGHYETEQFTSEILYDILSEKFTNFALLISGLSTNPVRYY